MKLRFKLIPFLLSLLIVLGATAGIAVYSYKDWSLNKVSFLNDYFHNENHNDYETTELIENMVKWRGNKYERVVSDLSFRDYGPNKTTYTETPVKSAADGKIGAYYKDGYLHYPGWFDVALYAIANEYEGSWSLSYYFMFFNIVYRDKDFDPTNFRIVFTKGTNAPGETNEDNPTPDEVIASQLDSIRKSTSNGTLGATATNYFSWSSDFKINDSAYSYYIWDNGFEDTVFSDTTPHYVLSCSPHNNFDNSANLLSMGETTFSIFYFDGQNEDGTTKIEELVEGTLKNIPETAEDFIEKENLLAGYGANYYTAPYKDYIWKKVLLHAGIAFGISAIIAFLFYLLWMTPTPSTEQKSKKNKSKK